MTLSLAEATKRIVEIEDPDAASRDPELLEFTSEVRRVGWEIMENVSNEDCESAVGFIKSCIMADLVEDGNLSELLFLMTHDQAFMNMIAVALRISVGLAAMEEWK